MTAHGKWSDPDVPHKGWSCVDVEDLGEPAATCEMCETQEIRYVHHMEHPDYRETLAVGCVCAEHMEQDYVGPRLREKQLRQRARWRQTWAERSWHRAANDYRYLNTEGFHVAVFPSSGAWMVRVVNRATEEQQRGRRRYATAGAAMDGALDALLWAKEHL